MTQTDAGKLADELAQYCARKEFTQHEEQMFADILDALRTPPTGNATVDVTGLSDVVVEDIRSHIRGSLDGAATYDYELGSGWRCFHCGEMFRTHGGAALHFGKPADKAACLAQLQERGEDEQPVAWRWHYKLESDRWFYQPFKPGLSQLSQKWEVEIEPLYAAHPPLPDSAGAGGEMRAALEPFAKLAEFVTETQRDSRPFIFGMDNVIAQRLTIGDLRRAKAALSPFNPGEKR